MAVVTTNSEERTNEPNTQIVNVTVATNGDTFESKFGNVRGVWVNDQTTTGGASATFSGSTVTIACTNGDVCDLLIWGLNR